MAGKPELADSVGRLLVTSETYTGFYQHFAVAVHGAITSEPGAALSIAVASYLWWTGAEAFDDLADGDADMSIHGLQPSEFLIAATLCLSELPLRVIGRQELPQAIKEDWISDFLETSITAASGQLKDTRSGENANITWQGVMESYAAKTGAPYARDAAMAARLATDHLPTLRSWRALGALFGVLRQLHNDRSAASALDDNDLINGTHTLLLAHALEVLPDQQADDVHQLRPLARHQLEERTKLWHLLRDPAVATSYDSRVETLRRHARHLLDQTAPPSAYRDALAQMIDSSATAAMLTRETASAQAVQ